MRAISIATLTLCIALISAPSFAGGSTLTNDRAKRAIDVWLAGAGSDQVTGVLEIPAENSARVELILSNFKWHAPKNDAVTAYALGPGGEIRTYNGRATAIFVHYTDGRWVLQKIETPMGSYVDLNVVAN